VLITSTDGKTTWGTVGVSANIVEASWRALVDSVEYKLMKDGTKSVMESVPPVSAGGIKRRVGQ
jgi:hypothetical protein